MPAPLHPATRQHPATSFSAPTNVCCSRRRRLRHDCPCHTAAGSHWHTRYCGWHALSCTTCRKKKCNKYTDEKKKRCKKTCDLCEGLPPSAPPPPPRPPSPPACEDNNIPGFGSFWCKLNTGSVTDKDADFCNDERFNFLCKKTCGLCL